MKKVMISALLLMAIWGQSYAQMGAFVQSGMTSAEGYSIPRTAVSVILTQEHEEVLRGPYAKYASKYLGVTGVAQTDKEVYRIVGAKMNYTLEPDPTATFVFDSKADVPTRAFTWLSNPNQSGMGACGELCGKNNTSLETPFTDMGVSSTFGRANLATSSQDMPSDEGLRMDAVEKSVEQMAADAAAAIFKLRKRRFELITGEQGENVFGQGLSAALEQINKLEAEYLALFVGKRTVQVSQRTFTVIPVDAARGRVTVCRFSETGGLTSESDMSGRPINIEYAPEKNTATAAPMAGKRTTTRTVPYRVPRFDVVRVMDGATMLTQERAPFYQFGASIDVPVI